MGDDLIANAADDGQESYVPEPPAAREGIALCLSGGGFRAALFHMGALRRLNELKVLGKVDAISSVSAGGIFSAHLAQQVPEWPAGGEALGDWEGQVAEPFREFAARDIRTGPILKRWTRPWNWFRRSVEAAALAEQYERHLTDLRLSQLPERPRRILCATDMVFGVNWVFERDRVGDYRAGYVSPAPDWPLARAVACSSCFPPVFAPACLPIDPDDLKRGTQQGGPSRDKLISQLRLTDGGVYDNLGLEPVWKKSAVVLVSDGGAPVQFVPSKTPIRQITRYSDIMGSQCAALRKRWLISSFAADIMQGAYWGIGSATARYGDEAPAGYSKPLAREVIARVRTDLAGFTEAEMAVLENHGYLLAEAAIRKHVPLLAEASAAPLSVPHPDWLDEDKVRHALRKSHKRKMF
jgi:NTE family protein